jgi:hypothetical protein
MSSRRSENGAEPPFHQRGDFLGGRQLFSGQHPAVGVGERADGLFDIGSDGAYAHLIEPETDQKRWRGIPAISP